MPKAKIKTKTWKLGEVCQGGIITVEIQGKVVTIIGKEWDFSTGSRRSSDQSNAKEFTRGTGDATDPKGERKALEFLQNLSTSYHADNIMKWIGTHVTWAKSDWW